MSEVFTFVDATHLISKVGLWKGRYKAIELRLESLNNKTLEKVSADRAHFEHVFSKENKRVRYKGIAKNQFSAFMQAISFNFKRLLALTSSTPPAITR